MFDLLQGCLSFSCFPQIFHRINKQVGCLLFLLSLCRLCSNSRPRQLNTNTSASKKVYPKIRNHGEGPSRGLLRDYELSDGTFEALLFSI